MRKTSLIVAIALLGLINAKAQNLQGDLTVAPRIGLNYSNYLSNQDYNTRFSFATGAVVEYYFSDRWSFRTGLLYDPMGAEDELGNIDQLSYLTLPLNMNWHFGKKRNWYLNFGVGLAILIDAKGELTDGNTVDIKEVIPGSDFGLMLGIGYKFDVTENVEIIIEYQEFAGLYNLNQEDVLPNDIRNTRGAFNVGVIFTL